MVGPTIWPKANTAVNALIPLGQLLGATLCLTSAVVEATKDKNTAPNNRPDKNITKNIEVIAGNSVAKESKALKMAKA